MENHAKNGKIITKYKQYLKLEKSFSSNTIDAYLTDLDKLMAYLTLEGKDCLEVTLDDLETFSAGLHDIGINARSQARILSGVRAFYRFLLLEDYIQQDPCELLESPQTGRHLPDVLTVEEIDELIAKAEDIIEHPEVYREKCRYKKLATLFYEPSTRTRLSFESAMYELGGQVLGFHEAQSSSATKGESVADTARTVSCFADIIAMRHPKEGAPLVASMKATVPVINAGDGGHQHPTQTLTDLLTIHSLKGHLDNLTIGLCGDLKFGRTVHSLIHALIRYPNVKFVLISPEELRVPSYIREDILEKHNVEFEEVERLEDALPKLDILYMTRVQKERFFNEEDYVRMKDFYILDKQKMELAPKDMYILHPLPRVNEIAVEVDDDPRAAYFKQAQYGVYVRMALILRLLEVEV